jgi:hypothetical protein
MFIKIDQDNLQKGAKNSKFRLFWPRMSANWLDLIELQACNYLSEPVPNGRLEV